MKKIAVGDEEYFIENEKYTAGDFERMEEFQKVGNTFELMELCRSLVRKCLGENIYDSIPMSDYPEVFAKTLAEILLPDNASEKEKMVADILAAFMSHND